MQAKLFDGEIAIKWSDDDIAVTGLDSAIDNENTPRVDAGINHGIPSSPGKEGGIGMLDTQGIEVQALLYAVLRR